jgi:hypothetical protein
MEIRAGIWRVFKEGIGVGAQQRLAQVILARSWQRTTRKAGVPQQFLDSASAAVSRYGPLWANREVGGRPVGVWLLVCTWLVASFLLVVVPV